MLQNPTFYKPFSLSFYMGTALLKIKIMPASTEADLKEIAETAKKIVEENKGKNFHSEEEPVAFGLKALIVSFDIDESDEVEPIEEGFKEIKEVNSVQVVDMRRAFG